MCHVENEVLPEIFKNGNILYCRFVDDIFLTVENFKVLETIKNKLEGKSVLKFTMKLK